MAKAFPSELQYHVTQMLLAEHDESSSVLTRQTLLTLRRTCKFFAGMTIIEAAIFTSLKLEASEANVKLVRSDWAILTMIAPFIRNVTLLPSVYNVNLDLLDFKRLMSCAIKNHPQLEARTRAMLTFSEASWNGDRVPNNDSELDEVFELYRGRAQSDNNLVSAELEGIWTALFRGFQQPVDVSLPAFIYDHPLLPDTEDLHISDPCPDLRSPLRDSSAETYGRFTGMVLRSFVAADTNIRSIEIDSELAMAFMAGILRHGAICV